MPGHTRDLSTNVPPGSQHRRSGNQTPTPFWITVALNHQGLYGPSVDHQCGVAAPTVDQWEDGWRIPTTGQIETLSSVTGFAAELFYEPAPKQPSGQLRRGRSYETVMPGGVDLESQELSFDEIVGYALGESVGSGEMLIHLDTVYIAAARIRAAGLSTPAEPELQQLGARARRAARRGDEFFDVAELTAEEQARAAARRRWGAR